MTDTSVLPVPRKLKNSKIQSCQLMANRKSWMKIYGLLFKEGSFVFKKISRLAIDRAIVSNDSFGEHSAIVSKLCVSQLKPCLLTSLVCFTACGPTTILLAMPDSKETKKEHLSRSDLLFQHFWLINTPWNFQPERKTLEMASNNGRIE